MSLQTTGNNASTTELHNSTSSNDNTSTTKKVSRNVYVMLVLCLLWGFSDSIWTGTIVVAWVQLLAGGANATNSNSKVGYVEATQGMAMLLTALPVGYIADKYSRQLVIRAGGIGFFVATTMTLIAVINPYNWNETFQYYIILFSMALWGTGQGIFNGPSQALFADSIPKGERTKWYSRLMMCYMIPSIAGPIAAIILLTYYGDAWTFNELRPVFIFGVVAEFPPAVLSMFMRDDLALNNGGDDEDDEDEEEEDKKDDEQDNATIHTNDKSSSQQKRCCSCITKKSVPYVLFASSLLTALGSGMTIKFFPLFFKSSLDLTPRGVQLIYVIVPLLIAIFTKINEKIAKILGRIQTILLSNIIGVSLLCTMSILVEFYKINTWYIVVPVYLVRTGIMNSTYALQESVLMDFVPKETRARWKSLESVASFGWCGSAVLGGILADASSYSSTFFYTAGLQFLGTIVIGLLISVVPIEEKKGTKKKEGDDATTTTHKKDGDNNTFGTNDLEERLLG